MSRFFDPPVAKPLLPKEKIPKIYKSMRFKVFMGSFLGYAGYYLVRKNLSLAAPGMIEDGLIDKAGVGVAMSAVSIAYAFSKFIMGSVSDRSDARKFLVVGLILAALSMMSVGLIPFGTNQALNVAVIFGIMLIVGWISGMGWPPCGRIMAHWFSQNERSFKMSIWNTSHTLGGGSLGLLVSLGFFIFASAGIEQTWRAAFIVPSLVALAIAVFCWWALRDTPQSCGLPSINEYRNDWSGVGAKDKKPETKIPFKTLFVDYIFKNKLLWVIAFANSFVYMVRYGVGDWAPIYLQEMNIMTPEESNLAFAIHNYAGIPGTIICGWISAKFFKGRCTPPNVIFMAAVLIGTLIYWQAAPIAEFFAGGSSPETVAAVSKGLVYFALCLVGFCIYGPVALIGIQALNLVPKNAAGTSAGFVGLFGYLFGDAILSKLVMGTVAETTGWGMTFILLSAASMLAMLLCSLTWRSEKRLAEN